jgi:TPR repeat protein
MVTLLRRDFLIAGLPAVLFACAIGSGLWPVMPAYAQDTGACRAALRPLILQQNPDKAQLQSIRELCQREADAGDPEAIYQLSFFSLGLDSWDPAQATSLILAAAERDVAEAQYWLAWQYDSGPLLPNDPALALQWYQASAESDHPLALQRLAEAYADGSLGLKVDRKKASQLKARAARCAAKSG